MSCGGSERAGQDGLGIPVFLQHFFLTPFYTNIESHVCCNDPESQEVAVLVAQTFEAAFPLFKAAGETERASERVQQRVDQRIDPPAEDVDWQGPNEPMLPQNTIEEPEPEECEAGVVLQSI